MTIGKKIQEIRKASGLSQKELGKRLGVSASMIGQYENNLRHPKQETLEKIAKALELPVHLFYPESPPGFGERTTNDVKYILRDSEMTKGQKIQVVLPIAEVDERTDGETWIPLIRAFDRLNDTGKKKVVEYAIDLVESQRYKNAAHEDNQTSGRSSETENA